jgi:oligoendopeptidase F
MELMTAAATPERATLDDAAKWDLSLMYESMEAWESHARELALLIQQFAGRKGRSRENAAELLATLQLRDKLQVGVEKLHAYATMRHHEDMRQPAPQALEQRARALGVRCAEAGSWFQPELLEIPEDELRGWLERDDLAVYRHFLEELLRTRRHILSPREEELLAMSSQATEAAVAAHSLLSNTELRWRTVQDPLGRDVEVTPALYYQAMHSKDRRYRRDAFVALHDSHADVKSTLAATLAGALHRDWYFARARHYESCLQASLDAENLPVTVYHTLLETVEAHLPLLHRYVEIKKRVLGLDQVHAYDLHVDLVDRPERAYSFEEARDLVVEGTQPFGPEYGGVLRRAFSDRWIDVYENRGKMSGAYNMGTYSAPPYVLLNFKGTFHDVSTLAHELGHAMQSWFAKEHQPPVYAGYPMFTAEVASTAAEIVFKQFMLDRAEDPQERAYLINQMLEDMRGTVFRQTQFARLDLAAHQLVERGDPITAEVLMGIGRETGQRYYGPDFASDPSLDVEVLRIPHYYHNFYVYRYATSYCAAVALAQRIREGASGAVEQWMTFLKTGNSRYALDMLQTAGVDMTTPRPIAEAMCLFERLLDQLEELAASSSRSLDRPPSALPGIAGN